MVFYLKFGIITFHLKLIIGQIFLSIEEFNSLISQIEYKMTNDPNVPTPLIPAHFLYPTEICHWSKNLLYRDASVTKK